MLQALINRFGKNPRVINKYSFLSPLKKEIIHSTKLNCVCVFFVFFFFSTQGDCIHQVDLRPILQRRLLMHLLKDVYRKCPGNFVHQSVTSNGICKQCRPRSDCSWRSSLIRGYTVYHSTMCFKKQLHKKQNSGQIGMEAKIQAK